MYVCEGKATRLAELALIFIPIYNVALSAKQTCCLPFMYVCMYDICMYECMYV